MLSKKAQYSLNALVHLAKKFNKGPVMIKDIARDENLPRKFLEVILLDLKKMGLLESKIGKGGGYFLIKKPEDITFADVIIHFDGDIGLLPCVKVDYKNSCIHCNNEEQCGLRSVTADIRDKMLKILKSETIAGVIAREKKQSHFINE